MYSEDRWGGWGEKDCCDGRPRYVVDDEIRIATDVAGLFRGPRWVQPINQVGEDQETTMSRTLYERVIADRFGSAPRGGERRRRGARDIDLDVARTRHHAAADRSSAITRPIRFY